MVQSLQLALSLYLWHLISAQYISEFDLQNLLIFNRSLIMAVQNGVALEPLERQWVKKSIELQLASLKRSRNNEMVGSDIWNLRTKEIDNLGALLVKFS